MDGLWEDPTPRGDRKVLFALNLGGPSRREIRARALRVNGFIDRMADRLILLKRYQAALERIAELPPDDSAVTAVYVAKTTLEDGRRG